jgi:hypothetical protein
MTTLISTLLLAGLAIMPDPGDHIPIPVRPITVTEGTWSQYGKSPTDGQIWYHSTQTKLLENPDAYDAFIAVQSCDDVGKTAWIKVGDHQDWLLTFIFDCSGHSSTTQWFKRANIIGELDYYTARELDILVGRGVVGAITFNSPYRN